MVGHDGKTGFQRHFGKPVRDEGLEFGELVYYRRKKNSFKDLEPRWMPGVWLGKPWGGITRIVYVDGRALEAYAV